MSSGGNSTMFSRKSWDLNPGQHGFFPRGIPEVPVVVREGCGRTLLFPELTSGLAGFEAPALPLLG